MELLSFSYTGFGLTPVKCEERLVFLRRGKGYKAEKLGDKGWFSNFMGRNTGSSLRGPEGLFKGTAAVVNKKDS
jgi:hypothetical protein